MGYTTDSRGIQNYWPDDSDSSFYIASDWATPLSEILETIKEKWPDTSLDDISIEAMYFHTHCIGYDLYDPGDYTNFLCIRRKS